MTKRLVAFLGALVFCGTLLVVPSAAFAEDINQLSITDPNPPVLKSISIDRKTATVGDTVTFSYDIEDADGIKSVNVGMHRKGDEGLSPMMVSSGDTTKQFSIFIDSEDALGVYEVTTLAVTDKAGYISYFASPEYAATHEGYIAADLSGLEYEIVDPSEVPAYEVVEGANQTVDIASDEGVTVRFDGPLDKFFLLQMDGITVSQNCYTLAEGSTVVTLKSDYLKTLSEGEHTLTAVYTDGAVVSTSLTITNTAQQETNEGNDGGSATEKDKNTDADSKTDAKDKTPTALVKTGDTTPIQTLAGVSLAASVVLVASFAFMKRKEML